MHSLTILSRSLSLSAKPRVAVDLPHKLHPSSHSAFGRTHHPSTPRKNEPMKALLLYPELPERFWSFKHILRFVGQRAILPALGLFTVAAMLPDQWETRLIDVTVCPWREKNLAVEDMVLISAMIAPRASKPPILTTGGDMMVSGADASSRNALVPFFGRRFGKGLLSMIVVPAVRSPGCLIYKGQCRGWRRSVVEDARARAWRRPLSA